jgi:uncharacterized iron-regulated membrane protein
LRFDDTKIPGLPSTIGYVRFQEHGAEGITKLLLEKLGSERVPTNAVAPKSEERVLCLPSVARSEGYTEQVSDVGIEIEGAGYDESVTITVRAHTNFTNRLDLESRRVDVFLIDRNDGKVLGRARFLDWKVACAWTQCSPGLIPTPYNSKYHWPLVADGRG